MCSQALQCKPSYKRETSERKKNEEKCGDRGQLIVFLGVVRISPREYSSGWMEVSVCDLSCREVAFDG